MALPGSIEVRRGHVPGGGAVSVDRFRKIEEDTFQCLACGGFTTDTDAAGEPRPCERCREVGREETVRLPPFSPSDLEPPN